MEKELNFLFGEEDFEEKMNNVVIPFLRVNLTEGDVCLRDEAKLHYYFLKNPQEIGTIVISHGFCEFNGKYHEVMYYFYQMGYSVFFPEHRGHGHSQREVEDLCKVYIEDFDTYVEDFREFVEQVVLLQSNQDRLYLYAHSMGGAIGALFLEKYPDVFRAAVLSSPMMALNFGKYSIKTVKFIFTIANALGWKKKYAPGQHGFDNINVYETSSAQSRPRYDYVFKLRQTDEYYCTYGSTYGWVMAGAKAAHDIQRDADKVNIPVLLFQAGQDTLVKPIPQQRFVKKLKNAKFVRFETSKHEIFNATEEVRREYYSKLFKFLGDN